MVDTVDGPVSNSVLGDTSPLLDGVQAARMLGLHRRTLENWRCRGEGPVFLRVGRAIRYRPSDVNAWLDGRRFQNTGGNSSRH